MPITQIPFQDPVAPPERPEPEQLGLYDVRDWETAYTDPSANVPHLLIQLQDDLSRSRRREAAWISIIVHLLLFIVAWNFKLIEKYLPWHPLVVVSQKDLTNGKDVTFLALPSDLQKAPRPKTNVISDKDRIAMSRHLDPKELRKILATPPPGAPGLSGPRAPQPAAQQPPAMAQNQPPQPEPSQQATHPPSDPNQLARLQIPVRPNSRVNEFAKYASPMTAGSAVQQATEAAAASRGAGQGGQEGDFGLNTGARGRPSGSLEILSDTLGVDFFPYLQRVKIEIYKHWYEVLPESVMPPTYKKGKLMIEFAISEDGKVVGMKLVDGSGDTALDRAAWGGVTGSDPFPPLPPEFTKAGGHFLSLRCTFTYNLTEADLH
jgi:TonB family protein